MKKAKLTLRDHILGRIEIALVSALLILPLVILMETKPRPLTLGIAAFLFLAGVFSLRILSLDLKRRKKAGKQRWQSLQDYEKIENSRSDLKDILARSRSRGFIALADYMRLTGKMRERCMLDFQKWAHCGLVEYETPEAIFLRGGRCWDDMHDAIISSNRDLFPHTPLRNRGTPATKIQHNTINVSGAVGIIEISQDGHKAVQALNELAEIMMRASRVSRQPEIRQALTNINVINSELKKPKPDREIVKRTWRAVSAATAAISDVAGLVLAVQKAAEVIAELISHL